MRGVDKVAAMNGRQLRIMFVAAVAVGSLSLSGAIFPSAIGAQTQSVSSGTFVEGNTTLEDPPGPTGLNLSSTPWLQAYYQFFEPPNGTENESVASGREPGGGTDLLPILAAVGTAVTALTGVGAMVWVRWLWRAPDGFEERPDTGGREASPTAEPPVPPGDLDPSNEVYQAWCEMVRRLEVTRPHVMTPRELARTAVEQGFEREPVESLTQAFEQVRYGEADPSADRTFRARVALEELAREGDA
jgi:hypothetical protein